MENNSIPRVSERMGHEGFFSCSFFAGSDLIRSRIMMLLLSASLPLVAIQKEGDVLFSVQLINY